MAQPLSFVAEVTFPPDDVIAKERGWNQAQCEAYEQTISPTALPVHRLLGHPDRVQRGDMAADCRLAANGIPTAGDLSRGQLRRRDELVASAQRWRLLLQVDADSGVRLEWGGGGRLYVWIRETDLGARHFDDCWVILQTD